MNKEEVVKLADICDIDLYPESRNGIDRDALIAFANACEKIGMEKAAKICEVQVQEYHPDGRPRSMEYVCADAIRATLQSPAPHEPPIPAT